MALGDPYIDDDDLKAYLGISGTAKDALLTAAAAAASQWVNDFCGRDFNKATEVSARVFEARTPWVVDVDDFWDAATATVAYDTAEDRTYTTSITAFDLYPLNGMENGQTGYPYRKITIRGLGPAWIATGPVVQVSAKWGWAAVPDKVKQATRILAAELFQLKDAPLGVAGVNDFGPLRVREVPQVALLLAGYRHPLRSGELVA